MMNKKTATEIKAEIASLQAQLKALETPRKIKIYVLVTEEMRIYGRRYAFKKVAERHAAEKNSRGNGKLTVMLLDDYREQTAGKTRTVYNAMTGQPVEEAMDTPYSCSVSSESYWCN